MTILHAVQDEVGYVPEAAIAPLSRAEVHGVVTYYHTNMSNTINGCGSGNCACKSAASVQRRDPFDDTDYGTPLCHADID